MHQKTLRSPAAPRASHREQSALDAYVEADSMRGGGLRVGSRFGSDGRYELLSVIGVGGTSVVHSVHDHLLDRRLAGKFVIADEEKALLVAAELEARATARLRHPNIVTIHDVGVHGGIPFLLMELLEGRTLADALSAGKMPCRRALDILIDVSAGLQYAHQQGVFHLDLKPGNVHIGSNGRVKLMDFGVGSKRLTVPAEDDDGSQDSVVVGTPHYMAPEQWNLGPLDARTDVWALGILLYETLSGRLPYDGQHPGFAMASGTRLPVPRLSQELGLPGVLDRIIERALALEPARRFQSVSEFLRMLHIVALLLLDKAVHGLTSSELRLAGSANVPDRDFTAEELQALTLLPGTAVSEGLDRLVRRGTLRARRLRSSVRYSNVDPALTRACFERLPLCDRMSLLDRLFVGMPG